MGVNLLDEACKEHDIEYSQLRDLNKRHVTDQILTQKAFQRFQSKNAEIDEKAAALAITGIMKEKKKSLQTGFMQTAIKKRGAIGFQRAVARGRNRIKGTKDALKAVKLALAAIGNTKVRAPRSRVLRIPKSGGIPLIPIFSALGAITNSIH